MKAYVLVNTEPRKEEKVRQQIKKIPEVKEAYIVYGVYDLIVELEALTWGKIKEVVIWNIRRISGVRSTLTLMVVNKEG